MSWQAALCILLTSFGISALHGSAFFADSLSGRFARRTLPAVIGIPVVAGALATAGARAGWWPFSVAAWLMTLAAVTGLGLVVAMAVRRLAEDDRRLTELAIRDPLTGAYNRRHFVAEATAAAAPGPSLRRGRARSPSSTSTTSRRSTTSGATRRATRCSCGCTARCAPACAPPTCSAASAATSSRP